MSNIRTTQRLRRVALVLVGAAVLIAAPQCGQTKVGATMAAGVTAGIGASIVAGTCSSSRAWARC